MKRTVIATQDAPEAIGPYSQGIQCGNILFISGQIPIDPGTGQVVVGSIREQTEQVLKNLKAVVAAAGGGLENIIKTTVYLKSMGDFTDVNETYASYFKESPPARACVEVSRLPKDVGVEIDAIAVVD